MRRPRGVVLGAVDPADGGELLGAVAGDVPGVRQLGKREGALDELNS